MSNKFNVGNLVSFKSHPLLKEMYIKGDGKYVPPIMLVKEVFFENKNKKNFDEVTGKKIADKIRRLSNTDNINYSPKSNQAGRTKRNSLAR